nr:D-alanyl-D-alanine carboxypeptidase family protein [Clostridium cavendishii]
MVFLLLTNNFIAYGDEISNDARCAIALDSKSKQVLYEKKAYEVVPMASTTKILTAITAIKYGNLDEEITISKNSAGIRGSTVGYRAGEKIKLKELLFGLMFKSGNDAAIAIAEYLGGSVEGFAMLMNDMAKNIGLLDSHFESPHGLDSQNHFSTAYDLALVTSKAMENDLFREIVGSKEISKAKYNFTRDYNNINKILWNIPNANGVKTGYTGQAGKCLVSSINHNGRDVIIVVLNCTPRWKTTEKIYKYVDKTYDFKEESLNDLVKDTKINGKDIKDDKFYYVTKKGGEFEKNIKEFQVPRKSMCGDILGKISIIQGKELKSEYIYKK